MDQKIYLSVVAAFASAAVVMLLGMLAAPIFEPLAWALVIGIATIPYNQRLVKRFPRYPGRAAGLMVLAVTVCFVLPMAGLIAAIAQSAPDWIREAQGMVQNFPRSGPAFLHSIPFADKATSLVERAGIDVGSYAAKYAGVMSGAIVSGAAAMAKGLAELLFVLAVALFILFFIYRDGEQVVATISRRFSNHQHLERYLKRFQATTTAVAVGTLFTCLVQGTTAGIGYFFAGVPAPVMFGAFTAIAALVPVVGTGVVWVPLVVIVAIKGTYLKAVFLGIWCMFMVGLADNAIRPLAVGAKGDVPVLAVVLGAICGVTTIGLLGLIVGPIIFATVINLWQELARQNDEEERKVLL